MLLRIESNYNFHDYFIIFVIASTILGTAQISIISHTFVIGIFCLPFALKEVHNSLSVGKFRTIVLFMIMLMIYAVFSVFWAPKNEYLFREIWILFWNIIIFVGLYYNSKMANNAHQSFLIGWRVLICLTLIIAAWEIFTDSHLPKVGDFNEDSDITTIDGQSEHRIFAAVTYKNLNSYVTLLCMAVPILVYGLFLLRNKWLSIFSILGCICVLLVNASRGGLMCLIIDVFVFVVLFRKQKFPYKWLVTLMMFVSISFFIYRYGMIIAEQSIGRIFAYGTEDIMSDAGRWDVWKMGLEFCIDSFGFGWGVGSMQPLYASTGFWLHFSHNFVVEFIMQYGIWLFIPFAIMLFKNWVYLVKNDSITQKMLGWMLLLSFVPLAIIDDSYLPHTYVWIWLVTQFVIVNSLKIDNE